MSENLQPDPTTKPDQAPKVKADEIKSETFVVDQTNHNESINNTETVTNIETVINNFNDDDRRLSARRFTKTDVDDVSDPREDELKALYVGDPVFTDSLVAVLARERVLFLTGQRGIGKQTTALYVASCVADARDLERSTARIAPLDAQIQIELRDVTAAPEYRRRVIVFDDALARKSASLSDIFGKLDRVACDRLVCDLVANDAYLIVTVASDDLRPFRQQVDSHVHVRELAAEHSPALIEDGYARKLEWITVHASGKAAHAEELAAKNKQVVDVLKTLPSIASFIDFYVRRDAPDLESALDDYTDAGRWFRTSLTGDFDAWCAALALVLAQSTTLGEDVSWIDFEQLRRLLSDRLKADKELFPQWREKERGRSGRVSGEWLDDDVLRTLAQIEVISNPSGDTVRFVERVHTADLWKTALMHNRRVLNIVIPALRTLAEQKRAVERMMRVIAARAVGRIGEVDPDRLVRPLVRHWGASWIHGDLVGRLMQGVLGSTNPEYRESAWQHIAGLVNEDIEVADPQLVSAIIAYAHVAAYDRGRAMKCLGEIVIERLSPAMANLHQAARIAAAIDRTAANARSRRRAVFLRRQRELLMQLAGTIEVKYKEALAAMGKAVAYIAYDDPIDTLKAMRDWTSKGGQAAGVTVAMLFLNVIAYDLVQEDSSSPLLLSLSNGGREAVSELAAFLADVYSGIHSTFSLPVDVQRELQSLFTDCLTSWARAGVESQTYRSAIEDLFVTLSIVRGGLMCEEIYSLLGSSAYDDEEMRSFAVAVRKRLDN